MLQIYRIVIVGVLCSQFLLASLVRTPYEVNTFTSNRRTLLYAPLITACVPRKRLLNCGDLLNRCPIKLSDTNDDRYKSLGFESTFDGSAGGVQWSELVRRPKD